MELVNFEVGPVQNNVYVVYDDTKECIIIDAPLGASIHLDKFIKENDLTVKSILITHSHWDHIGELYEIKQMTGADIYVHKDDAYRLESDKMRERLPIDIKNVSPDVLLKGGEELSFGKTKFRVVHTPGHTEGGVCFVFEEDRIVFTGDTLFAFSIGRTDFPGGNFDVLINSIKTKLLSLGDDFIVYPGHGEHTTIKNEKQHNPFIK
ncbi:MAG: MBL fold metallo-hydrolase [Ignavibacteria bacterium]|jgi:hydroxyacylglutathione hydrolase|nr:MBL fold metallo-hydrolase [Ignavibacteria bacterium]